MTSVTVIGTGGRAQAMSSLAEKAGAIVQLLAADASDEIAGDLVILAVAYPEHDAVVEAYGPQLAGRIVLDIAEPSDPRTHERLLSEGSSGAEMLALALPESTIVKAFTATPAETLVLAASQPETTTVLVVGDDPLAKRKVMRLAGVAGVEVHDHGPLSRARELEQQGLADQAGGAGTSSGQVPA